MDPMTLFLGLLFGSIGMGYFIYGKKQQNPIALLAGMALCGLPYFIANVWITLVVGMLLAALPFIVKF